MGDVVAFLDSLPVAGWFCLLTAIGWTNLIGLSMSLRRDASRYFGVFLLVALNVALAWSLTLLLTSALLAPSPVSRPRFHFTPPPETAEPPLSRFEASS